MENTFKSNLNTPFIDLVVKLIELKNFLHYIEKKNFPNKKIRIEDNIFVAGSPRSGTTWLMEIMSDIPDYTFIFEPMQPWYFPMRSKIGFKDRTYLPADKNWPEGEQYLKEIFTGKIVTNFPTYGPSPKLAMRRLLAHKFIIKEIRLNRLLPWITKRFDFKAVILIIRHPCAAIASQFHTGIYGYEYDYPPYSSYFPKIENIIQEASEIEILDESMHDCLKRIKTKEEILAASWCLDTLVPLSYKKPYPWKTVFYENLIKNGEEVITDLFKEIGVEKSQNQIIRLIKKQSLTTPKANDLSSSQSDKQLSRWKKQLSKEQIERILNVVSNFGFDFYNENIEPDYDQLP